VRYTHRPQVRYAINCNYASGRWLLSFSKREEPLHLNGVQADGPLKDALQALKPAFTYVQKVSLAAN